MADHRVSSLLRRTARRAGFDLLRADHYSPVPDLRTLPDAVWDRRSPMPGVAFDLDAQLEVLGGSLRPFLDEFRPPRSGGDGYAYDNSMYPLADAAVLHALVRSARPSVVLEIGAGHSTLVFAAALARNGDDAEHHVVDPYPAPVLGSLTRPVELRPVSATDVPIDEFRALGDGDVLFIDTTHTVKDGGDVVYLLLEAIPSLAPGVLVHIHDVFRPYAYPRFLLEQFGVAWQEQYLVQALLVGNAGLEIVSANHALWRERHAELAALVPDLAVLDHGPSGLWLRTR